LCDCLSKSEREFSLNLPEAAHLAFSLDRGYRIAVLTVAWKSPAVSLISCQPFEQHDAGPFGENSGIDFEVLI
jgi:hypothetical protein